MVQQFLNKILEKILVWTLEEYFFFFEMLRWLAVLKGKIGVWQRWLLSQTKKRTWPGFRHKENNISEVQIAKNCTPDRAHNAQAYSQAAWVPPSRRITRAKLVLPVSPHGCGGERWSRARAGCVSRERAPDVPGAVRREPSGPNAVNKLVQLGHKGVH